MAARDATRTRSRANAKPAGRQLLREYVETALWVIVITFTLRAFVLQAFVIPSGSMLDTLLIGDFLFVNKLEYGPRIPFTHVRLPGFREPRRGDIIVFQYPLNPRQDYIKRCIATPGQVIEERNKQVIVDGRPLVEPYVIHSSRDTVPASVDVRDNFAPLAMKPAEYFMMGDNRDNSADSRYWGPMKKDLIQGRAMFIYWSWDAERFWPRWNRLLRIIH